MSKVSMKKVVVAGERVFLRSLAGRDCEEFVSLNRQSSQFHRGWVSPPTSPEQFDSFLERSRRADCVSFLICRVHDGGIVGSINLSQIFRGGFLNAYLGYYIGEQHARQGHMTEAVELMLRYAFEHLRLHRLEANIQPRNEASLALVKRLGFVREGYSRRYLKISGRWRDHERWAILAEDWRARKKRSRSSA